MSLCDTCTKSDSSCPVWYPSKDIDFCVEWEERDLINKDDPEYVRLRDGLS